MYRTKTILPYPVLKIFVYFCFCFSEKKLSGFFSQKNNKMVLTNNGKTIVAEKEHRFFPLEEPWPYRVAGNEQMLKVPAGTFKCTVIEGIDGWRSRNKILDD